MKILAEKVIETARNQVYFALRYLEPALFRLQPLEKEDTITGSDGKYYYYNADYLCRRFLQNPVEVEYDYLHTVLHCLFRHPMRVRLSAESREPESMRGEMSCENRQLELMRKESIAENQQLNFVQNEWMNESEYWNLAADIAVAEVIAEMELPQFQHVIPQQCSDVMEQIQSEVPFMDIPQIARYLKEHETQLVRKNGLELREIAALFYRDDHSFWTGGGNEADLNQMAVGDNRSSMQSASEDEIARKRRDVVAEFGKLKDEPWQDTEESWKEIVATITQNAENARQNIDSANQNAGTLIQNNADITQNTVNNKNQPGIKPPSVMLRMLRRMTRDTYDYTEFLRKFARIEECMKLDEDSFDYVYYAYGLSGMDKRNMIEKCSNWYDSDNGAGSDGKECDDGNSCRNTLNSLNRRKPVGKIALLEPLEYKEEYRIRDFVIAIDTSASCSGRLVQQFLNKTYHILKSTESFSDRVVVHILQCDCAIREDIRIESLRQFEEYLSQMRIRGMGGTDFRPVFDYVDQLCAKREIRNPGGLIYFTDGRGTYPKKPPAYRTAFVFVGCEDETCISPVPPWAMKLYLEENS